MNKYGYLLVIGIFFLKVIINELMREVSLTSYKQRVKGSRTSFLTTIFFENLWSKMVRMKRLFIIK